MVHVARVMNRELVGVSPSTRCDEAEAKAVASGVDYLLVLDCDDLVGVTSVTALHQAGTMAMVSDCMSPELQTISVSASVDEAAELMRRCDVGCLPVVAGGLILGVVTRDQVAETPH